MPLFSPPTRRRCAAFSLAATAAITTAALLAPSAVHAQNPAPAAQAPAAPPVATIHPADLRQPIYGFGGSQTYNGDALITFANRDAVYKALFQDLRMDIYRLRNYDGYPGQQEAYESKLRDFATGALRWGKSADRGGKAPVRTMFTAWSPPPALKNNNLVSGRSDGTEKGLENATLKKGADGKYVYDAYADWWVSSVRKFRDLVGALPDYVVLQNELDFPASYEGCRFLPSEGIGRGGFPVAGYDKALIAVSDKMQSAFGAQTPKIMGPETFSIMLDGSGKSRVEAFVDPTTEAGKGDLSRLFAVSYHLYGSGAESVKPEEQERFHKALQSVAKTYHTNGVDKPLFQNEYLEGDTMTQVAGMMSDTLTIGEASAYLVWIVSRDAHRPGYGLVYFRPEDGTIERRERFYAMKHFSYFVGEGWNRVAAECPDTSVKLSAFVGPDKKELVSVLINPTGSEKRITLDGPTDAKSEVFRSSEGEGGERWLSLGALPANRVVVLPKKSIVTVHWQ